MRFIAMVKSDATSEAGVMPDATLIAEMDKFNNEMLKAGVMLSGEGLHASSKGARVRYANGKHTVTDGPFAEAKELVGGFWVIEAKSKKDAVAWLERAPFKGAEVEIRPLYGPEDFPPDPAATSDKAE